MRHKWGKRVYATALPRADLSAPKESIRVAFNQWVRTDPERLFDAVWDADALTRTGGPLEGFATNPSLAPDHLHPSELSYEKMAPSLKQMLDKL